jgi:peptide deformylase
MAALSGAVHWHKTTDHMTIRPIVRYPDPRLALPAQPVTVFDGALRDLARDLLETMHAAPGIGITAPHIGVSVRVVVLDLDANDGARTYVTLFSRDALVPPHLTAMFVTIETRPSSFH